MTYQAVMIVQKLEIWQMKIFEPKAQQIWKTVKMASANVFLP
jgi:hypothetical protein